MSSLLVLQDKNEIVMASDTASSVTIENISYRVSDKEQKIFDINGYKVFASGQKHIRDLFIHIANTEKKNFSPIFAEKILKKYFLSFGEFALEVVIGEKLESSTYLYFLSSYNKYTIEKSFSDTDEIMAFTAGVQTTTILNTFEKQYTETKLLIDSLLSTYALNQTEEVGGFLEIHFLNSKRKTMKYKLPNIELKRKNFSSDEYLIVGERIIGKILMGNRLIIEDEDGLIRLSGSKQEIFDPTGKARVILGNFDTDQYGMKIDSGALEIINGLDKGHLNPDLVADLKDDSEIRADLRLESPLPNNITLNKDGITARTTTMPNHFARLDYRGLYVQGGALDLRTSDAGNRGVNITGEGISAYNKLGERTFFLDTEGNMISTAGTTADLYTKIEQNDKAIRLEAAQMAGDIAANKSSIELTATQIRQEVSESNKTLADGIANNKASITTTATQIRSEVSTAISKLNGDIANTNTAITQSADSIKATVNTQLTQLETKIKTETDASIELNKTGILSTVKATTDNLEGRLNTVNTSVSQLAGQISLKADSTTVTNLGTKVNTISYDMNVLTGQVSSKVSMHEITGQLVTSVINQSASSVKIQAKNIQLDGITEVASRLNIGTPGTFGERNIIFNNNSSLNVYNSISLEITSSGNLYLSANTIRFDAYYGGAGSIIDFGTARSINWGAHAPTARFA